MDAFREKNAEKHRLWRKDYWAKNRVRLSAQAKARRLNEPEKYREIRKRSWQKWYYSDPGRAVRKVAEWQKKNRDKVNAGSRKRRRENAQHFRDWYRKWRQKNRASVLAREARYRALRPDVHKRAYVKWKSLHPDRVRAKSRRDYEQKMTAKFWLDVQRIELSLTKGTQ